MRRYFILPVIFVMLLGNLAAQNVGIGVATPFYKLDIGGTLHSIDNAYFENLVGIGTTSPTYKLQVNNGAIALYNTTDLVGWSLNYNSTSNYFHIMQDAINRMVITNVGNVGIGTTIPAFKLDVAGSINASSNISADGNGDINGSLTVNGGKGVAFNPSSATNLKVVPFTTATFNAILPGFGLSAEGSFGLPGGFTSPPGVYIGGIDVTGGTAGELYRVQLVIYGCTATSCKARLLNTSPNPVNYSITWDMLAVGN